MVSRLININGLLLFSDDMVVDGNISVDEWCDCFSFADDHRHEPPCHKAKHAVDPHIAGKQILLSPSPTDISRYESKNEVLFF